MKYLMTTLIALFCAGAIRSATITSGGFDGIPFGLSLLSVVQELTGKYGLEPDDSGPDLLYRSEEGTELRLVPSGLFLVHYREGVRKSWVVLLFDDSERFSAFMQVEGKTRHWEIASNQYPLARSFSPSVSSCRSCAGRFAHYQEDAL